MLDLFREVWGHTELRAQLFIKLISVPDPVRGDSSRTLQHYGKTVLGRLPNHIPIRRAPAHDSVHELLSHHYDIRLLPPSA